MDDGIPSSRIISARWRCGPDRAECWSPASGGLRAPHTARLLVLKPAPHPLAIGLPRRSGDIIGKVAEPLTQRKHPQALALARPVQQGMKLRAQGLADRRSDSRQFPGELGECMAETVAQALSREERVHALGGAVEAIGQDASDLIGQLMLQCHSVELLIRLGQGRRTGVFRVAQMPDDTATNDRREVHFLCQTATVFFISQEIRGQRQTTPAQHSQQTLMAARTDETIEGHRREMIDDRAELQTQSSMGDYSLQENCF
jgi:hypothetical protein